MKADFKSRKLKTSIVKVNEKVKSSLTLYKSYQVYGVTKNEGITVTGNVTSEDLSEYIVVDEYTFAFNPYRVNIGSIGLSGKNFKGLVSPAYVVFKTKKDLLPEFLFHYLKSDIGIRLINWYGNRGGVRNALRFDDLGEIDIPDLNIKQQHEALIKLDIAQSSLKILYSELDLQQTYLQQLRQAILQEAVQGKLTSQNPKDEPAIQLLNCIKAEKEKLIKAGKLKKVKELPPITKDEPPFELPEGWVSCKLEVIAYVGTGATPLTSNKDYYNGKIPWITSSATGSLFVTEAEKNISEKAIKETNCKVYLKGTLIVAMYGQGKTRGQITELMIESATNQACAAIELILKNENHKNYIKYFFQKIYLEIRELAEGGAQPNLNLQKIKDTLIPLPPLAEQQRIVAKVQQLHQQLSQLETQVQQSRNYAQQLLQSVLKEVFENKPKEYEENELVTMAAE